MKYYQQIQLVSNNHDIDGLGQECSNSSAFLAVELQQSWTEPSIYSSMIYN